MESAFSYFACKDSLGASAVTEVLPGEFCGDEAGEQRGEKLKPG